MQKSNVNQTLTLPQALDTVSKIENDLTGRHADNWTSKYVPVSLVEMVEQAYGAGYKIHSSILPKSRSKDSVTKNGSYTLRAINDDVREFMGDKVQSELYISNSFDAKRSLRVSLGIYRQVCSNGLMMGVSISSIKARHTTGIIESVNGLELINPWTEIEQAYGWMEEKINQEQSLGIIGQLGLSPAATKSIVDAYNNPLRIEDSRGDVWSLYNVVNETVEQRSRSAYSFYRFNDNLNDMIKKAYEGL